MKSLGPSAVFSTQTLLAPSGHSRPESLTDGPPIRHGNFSLHDQAGPEEHFRGETYHARQIQQRIVWNTLGALAGSAGAVAAWHMGSLALTVIGWLVAGHFLHTFALSLHDAAHGTLHPQPRINEWLGAVYGTLVLVPLTAYRRAHSRHHACLASEDDPELYPFVDPRTSRAFRRTWFVAEIFLGYFVTPLLFLRSVLQDRTLPPTMRRQIRREYACCGVLVVSVLGIVTATGTWQLYLVGILVPAMVGAAYQTLRKYTEHLGLTGPSILQCTRSILPRDTWNGTISSLLQHVDHHGTHHVRARVPFTDLPTVSQRVYRGQEASLPVYRSYAEAFWAMLQTAGDPVAGPQWVSQAPVADAGESAGQAHLRPTAAGGSTQSAIPIATDSFENLRK